MMLHNTPHLWVQLQAAVKQAVPHIKLLAEHSNTHEGTDLLDHCKAAGSPLMQLLQMPPCG